MNRRPAIALRNEEGQVFPALLVLVLAIAVLGLVLFRVGQAGDLAASSQTAGDAAALAGARQYNARLSNLLKNLTLTDLLALTRGGVNRVLGATGCSQARTYAGRNDATLTGYGVTDLTVRVLDGDGTIAVDATVQAWVRSNAAVPPPGAGGGTQALGTAAAALDVKIGGVPPRPSPTSRPTPTETPAPSPVPDRGLEEDSVRLVAVPIRRSTPPGPGGGLVSFCAG